MIKEEKINWWMVVALILIISILLKVFVPLS